MQNSAGWLKRTLVLLCAINIAVPPGALAQDPQTTKDDTNSPLIQQFANQEKETNDLGADRDDPTFRLEWMRHIMSGYDAAARDNYLLQVQQQHDQYPDLDAVPPSSDVANNTGSLAFGGSNYAASSGQPVWVNIGPTRADFEENGTFSQPVMDSGRARAILPHPTDPNTVYFLTSGGGLWKTTDFYNNPPHWVPLTDNLPTTSGGWASFGRVPETIYLGMGDFIDQTLPGGFMVKSTDGGVTWASPVKLGASIGIRDVKVDTSTANDIVLVASDTGIWRSVDNGTTYTQVIGPQATTPTNRAGWSLAKTSAGWLATVQPCGPALGGAAVQCAQIGQLFLSTDLGATWSQITGTGYTAQGRTTIGIGAPGDSVVYLLTATTADSAQGDVFRSSDGGLTWTALGVNATKTPTNPNSNNTNMNLLHTQAYYNQMILVDPTDSSRNTVYIGGDLSTAKTTNGGSSWTLITNWLAQFGLQYSHADNHAAAFQTAGNKNAIMFGNDGGIHISLDGGAHFDSTRNENLVTHLFYDVAVTPSFPDQPHGGLQDNGTRIKLPGSTTYNQILGGDGVGAGWSQANSNTAVGSVQQAPRRLLTGVPGNSEWDWETISGLPADNFLQPITFPRATADPTGKIFFMASTSTMRRTDDGGVTSRQLYNNTASTNTTIRSSPHNIGVSPYSLDRIALGGAGGRMVITLNGSAATPTWQAFDLIGMFPPGGANGAGYQGFNYSVAWSDNNTLFVTAAAQIPGAIHVLKGTFNGSSWSFARSDNGLPDVSVQKVVPDPTDPTNQTLYAATDIGVYKSKDSGGSWTKYGAGLPNVRVSDLYIPPNGSYMLISTYGRGLWKLTGLTFGSASLVGDGSGANADGILDNGETGHVVVTLRNYGNTNLSGITGSVTADSSAISFPNGNSFIFPNCPAGGTTTGTVLVALNGAATGQKVNLNIAFGDPAQNLPTPMTVQRSFYVNYDEAFGTFDDVEAQGTAWTVTGNPTVFPDLFNWERREITGTQHLWAVRDSDGTNDVALVSPVLAVGSGPFSFSFTHRYAFESTFDGGVIEISTDDGGTWNDVGAANISPTYATAALNAAGTNPIRGRRAYTGRIAGYPASTTVTVSLGTAFANQSVRIRFRVGSDADTAAFGWELDNFAFSGLTNKPFIVISANPASNITGQINVQRSGYSYNPVTQKFSQVVTLANNTGTDVTGPVSYVLDNLSANATVFSPAISGTTSATSPAGSPYINVANAMTNGQSVSFTIVFANPTKAAITYTPRVLAGPGAR